MQENIIFKHQNKRIFSKISAASGQSKIIFSFTSRNQKNFGFPENMFTEPLTKASHANLSNFLHTLV